MSTKFSQKLRVQPTPKVCKSTKQGPRYVPIDEAKMGVALWWNGATSIGTPLAISQRLSMPAFVPPSSWTNISFYIGNVNVFFAFFYSPLFELISTEIILHEGEDLTGNAGFPPEPYGLRVPFDTGPKQIPIFLGNGDAGCRVTT